MTPGLLSDKEEILLPYSIKELPETRGVKILACPKCECVTK